MFTLDGAERKLHLWRGRGIEGSGGCKGTQGPMGESGLGHREVDYMAKVSGRELTVIVVRL